MSLKKKNNNSNLKEINIEKIQDKTRKTEIKIARGPTTRIHTYKDRCISCEQ